MKLRPVTYNLDVHAINRFLNISESSSNDSETQNGIQKKESEVQSGFVAQEVEQAAREVNYNFSGVDLPDNSGDPYSLRYAEFVVPLVKAIQEQQKMIEQLQEKVKQLEAQR